MSLFFSCFYDLATLENNPNRRPADFYFQYVSLLQQLKKPVVIFTDMVRQLRDILENSPQITIIYQPFKELAYYNRIEEITIFILILQQHPKKIPLFIVY